MSASSVRIVQYTCLCASRHAIASAHFTLIYTIVSAVMRTRHSRNPPLSVIQWTRVNLFLKRHAWIMFMEMGRSRSGAMNNRNCNKIKEGSDKYMIYYYALYVGFYECYVSRRKKRERKDSIIFINGTRDSSRSRL